MACADDLFRLAHRDTDGRLLVQLRPLGLGLAAGLVAELVLADVVHVQAGGRLLVGAAQCVSLDGVARALHERLYRQQGRDLAFWLDEVSSTAYEQVAGRLVGQGHLRSTAVRRLLRPAGVRYVPTSMSTAAMPVARLSLRLARQQPLDVHDAVLAALAKVTGIAGRVLVDGGRAAAVHLDRVLGQLPPALGQVVTCTDALVGSAVLAYQR